MKNFIALMLLGFLLIACTTTKKTSTIGSDCRGDLVYVPYKYLEKYDRKLSNKGSFYARLIMNISDEALVNYYKAAFLYYFYSKDEIVKDELLGEVNKFAEIIVNEVKGFDNTAVNILEKCDIKQLYEDAEYLMERDTLYAIFDFPTHRTACVLKLFIKIMVKGEKSPKLKEKY